MSREYRPTKKRQTRIPLKKLLPPPVLPESAGEAEPFEQPLAETPGDAPAPKVSQGGKARAKKIGKSKVTRITRSKDRSRWNSKKKPLGGYDKD